MKLNLGCGKAHKGGFVNIDVRPPADIVRDVLRGLPFADESVDEIYSENWLEHIPQTEVIWVMNEMHRVMKSGAEMTHLVPPAGTSAFYQDPTHLSHWISETITYFELHGHRNAYYGDLIKPWVIVERKMEETGGTLFQFTLRKP